VPTTTEISPPIARGLGQGTALRFVIMFGVVSLFADMTYEGGRSVAGPFLSHLGASGTVVGFVAGLGELLGYGLRLVSGRLSDRTGRYWAIALVGYSINLLAVPALALAGRWEIAALLLMLERTGKAIRNPARDAMLSYATHATGRGFGFGLHEAMDQTGALIGPLIVAAMLHRTGRYQNAFVALLLPAVLSLGALLTARRLYPRPRDLEPASARLGRAGVPPRFWLYLAGAGLIAVGYADFALIAFHFTQASLVPQTWTPLLYSMAMGMAAVAALAAGRLFDRVGIPVIIGAVVIATGFAPLVFLGGRTAAIVGMALWGVGMGAQDSIVRAAVAEMVPGDRRGAAFGLFDTGYGVSWFLGSALMGILYDRSVTAVVAFSVAAQLASIPVLLLVAKRGRGLSA
jgi:MFS family permease